VARDDDTSARLRDAEDRIARLEAERDDLRARLADGELLRDRNEIQQERLLQCQRELEASHDRYTDLYDFAPLPYVTLDQNGLLKEANLTAVSLLGYSREHLLGRALRSFATREDSRAVLEHLRRCRSGESPVRTELRIVGAHGKVIPFEVVSRPIRKNVSLELRTVFFELTERLAGESERQRLQQETIALEIRSEALRAAGEAKDRFLAMLSHELRTPLGAIANAAAVLERTALPPDAARMGGIVQRQSRHLTTMVDDLLDVSRVVSNKVALKRERVDLGALAARLAAELRAAGRLGAHELRLDATRVTVTGDPDRLLQVLRNLVDNALKYTPEGGRVDLRVAVEDGRAVVRVVDTGAGIEPAFAEILFEPFAQGAQSFDRPAGGLGLGLAIVRGIVRLHGGSVAVQSEGPGRGCEFVVRLPLTAEAAPAGAGPAAAERARPLRIALIEDHADTRASLRALLEAEGHSVREAVDGEAGAKLLTADPPDLAFVDLGLPRMDGFDVAKAARRAGVASRLVALTGYAQPEDQSRALKAGFDAVLVKPATLDALRKALAQTPPQRAKLAAAGG
jgi:PAS domain S-box-containing protein